MLLKPLARTGQSIPEIGLGTWKYHAGPEPLRAGFDAGGLFIDTAEAYGSEETVGQAIAGRRDRVFLASKVSPRHFRRAELVAAAEASLRRLGTDYLDLYQLHQPNPSVPIEETMASMASLLDAGKIRFVGVSNFSVAQMRKAQEALGRYPIVSNQVRYSLVDRTIERDLLAYCQVQGITVIAYTPLAHGLPNLIECDPRHLLSAMAGETGATIAQIALNWCLCQDGVVVIPKASSAERVRENCGASDWRLSEAQRRQLTEGIQFRRRTTLENLLRRMVPAELKGRLRVVAQHLPRGIRRRIS